MKTYNIGKVNMTTDSDGFPKGFDLKRDLTVEECKYILSDILDFELDTLEDCDNGREYQKIVNAWLRGDTDDYAIMDIGEPIGTMNLIPIIEYLQKREII